VHEFAQIVYKPPCTKVSNLTCAVVIMHNRCSFDCQLVLTMLQQDLEVARVYDIRTLILLY